MIQGEWAYLEGHLVHLGRPSHCRFAPARVPAPLAEEEQTPAYGVPSCTSCTEGRGVLRGAGNRDEGPQHARIPLTVTVVLADPDTGTALAVPSATAPPSRPSTSFSSRTPGEENTGLVRWLSQETSGTGVLVRTLLNPNVHGHGRRDTTVKKWPWPTAMAERW